MRIFAVVDEAHKLSYEETLTELIREARKYGVGILLASQSVKDFDRVVFDMVGTKISLRCSSVGIQPGDGLTLNGSSLALFRACVLQSECAKAFGLVSALAFWSCYEWVSWLASALASWSKLAQTQAESSE